MQINLRLCVYLLFFLAALVLPASLPAAQQPCQLPAVPVTPRPPGILSAEQERWIGEAVATQIENDFQVIEDDPVLDYLKLVGSRLAKHVPDPAFHFEFRLVDLPIVNAFAFPGGRVYATRKLVAFTRNEDELAGVLAHEIGHVVTHEIAQDWTYLFRQVLKVTEFGGRDGIFELYHELLENGRRNPKAFRKVARDNQRGQYDADAIALYVMAHAGYAPQAYVDFWDRYNETKGKTGNWFSDMFGTTKPEARRLREMLRAGKEISPACLESLAAGSSQTYDKWKQDVVAYSGVGRQESLPGLLASTSLNPPLQADMHTLRFSPDGKHLIAQNDSSIYVLTSRPMKVLFRIDAPEAYPAKFTPDSQGLVFHNSALRVEAWSIPEQQRAGVQELVIRAGCWQTELSPDGTMLGCLTYEYDLLLMDTDSAEIVYQKKSFFVPNLFQVFLILFSRALASPDEEITFRFIEMEFSPDARYFLATGDSTIGFDLTTREQISLPGAAKKMMDGSFAFLGPDRIFGVRGEKGEKSALIQFPSGKTEKEINVGRSAISSSGDGKFLLIRPIEKFPVGIVNLSTGKIFLAHEMSAMDIYGDVYVKQARSGEIALYDANTRNLVGAVLPPQGPLGRLRAATISDDLRWLAISERGRGAVWNLANGRRHYHTRGFRGAYFDLQQESLIADFPKFDKEERTLARLDLRRTAVQPTTKLEERNVSQYGPYLFVRVPQKKNQYSNENATFELRDAVTDRVLWSEKFPKDAPRVYFNWKLGTMAYLWSVTSRSAKDEIKQDPALQARAKTLREKEGDYCLRILDLKTGRTLGRLLIETGKGSFRITDILALGDRVVIADSLKRVLIYSLASGEQESRVFGRQPVLAQNGTWLAMEAGRGQLVIYDLKSMNKSREMVFPRRLSMIHFAPDGKRLFVLTSGQKLYSFDLAPPAQASATSNSPPH